MDRLHISFSLSVFSFVQVNSLYIIFFIALCKGGRKMTTTFKMIFKYKTCFWQYPLFMSILVIHTCFNQAQHIYVHVFLLFPKEKNILSYFINFEIESRFNDMISLFIIYMILKQYFRKRILRCFNFFSLSHKIHNLIWLTSASQLCVIYIGF